MIEVHTVEIEINFHDWGVVGCDQRLEYMFPSHRHFRSLTPTGKSKGVDYPKLNMGLDDEWNRGFLHTHMPH